jgi:hypothetical protein
VDPKTVIESYVDEVARRLPLKQRSDVGFELRSLLNEELEAKVMDAGRPADEPMTLALLGAFGRPQDVAARYRPPGLTIIEPAEARVFIIAAMVGVALQWTLSLPPVFALPETFAGQAFSRLGAWWVSYGLGAFWWPGLMVTVAMIAAWARRRWPATAPWKPRALDRDRINRPLLALGLAAWAAGAALWISMPWLSHKLPGVLPMVFAFDKGFLWSRGVWLPPLWAAHFVVYGVALVEGRWRKLTRRISTAFSAAICVLLAWFVVGGPIFRFKPTDDSARFALAIIVAVTLIWAAVRLYRERGRIRPPKSLANSVGA